MNFNLSASIAALAMCVSGVAAADEKRVEEELLEPEMGVLISDPESGAVKVKMEERPLEKDTALLRNPRLVGGFILGGEDLVTYHCIETRMPTALSDLDGGTIRFILQHETNVNDQLRVLDAHVAMEHTDDTYGERGRYPGRYGWTRYSGPSSDTGWVYKNGNRLTVAASVGDQAAVC